MDLFWCSPNASGLQSIVWRHEYDQSKDNSYREVLQTYNLEDCLNLKGLIEHLRLIAADAAHSEHIRFADKEGGSMPESASNLSKQLSNILLSAHGDYEQTKITLKNKDNTTQLLMTVASTRKDGLFHQVESSIRLFTLDEAGHAQIILGVNLSLHKLK